MEFLALFVYTAAIYAIGFIVGFKTRRLALKEFSREVKTNLKAGKFSADMLFGEGAENDNLEPDDFERKKKQQPIQGDRGFFA